MGRFKLLTDDEPRGEGYDELREDGLSLDERDECWRNQKGQQVCGAFRSNASWEYARCSQTAIKDNGRCRHHGGNSLKGRDSGTFKTGKYSKVLPDNVGARYEEVRDDEHLTDLREEIALIETRVHEVLKALDAKDSAELWSQIEEHFEKFQAANRKGETEEMAEQLRHLEHLIEEGAEQRSKWREIGELVDMKRRLVDSERRREKALQAYVPMEDFVMSMHTVDDILRRHVDDPETMREIARDLRNTFDLG